MDKNLTILLTLKDRCAYTRAFMSYANQICCPFKILIADGGASKEIEEVLQDKTNYPNLRYEYIRYPYDETVEHFHFKLCDVVKRVKTPLVVIIDNDDYFLLSALYKNIEFLRENPDFTSSRGGLWNLNLGSTECSINGNMYDPIHLY